MFTVVTWMLNCTWSSVRSAFCILNPNLEKLAVVALQWAQVLGPASKGWDADPSAQLFISTLPEPGHQAQSHLHGVLIRFAELPSGVSPNMCAELLSHIAWGFHFPFFPRAREVLEAEQRVKMSFIQMKQNPEAVLGSEHGGPSSVCILS